MGMCNTREIVGYDVQPVNIQSNETAALNRLTMTVKVRYVEHPGHGQEQREHLQPLRGLRQQSGPHSVEETLVREIRHRLVQDIFDRTLGSW